VAARRTNKLQADVRGLLDGLEDLERRLRRLDGLLEATRKAAREKARERAASHKGIRGKGPNVRDVAQQVLAKRRRPMSIQDSQGHPEAKKGSPVIHQNLGAALAGTGDSRVGRGCSLKR
jgi:hypothetical protein